MKNTEECVKYKDDSWDRPKKGFGYGMSSDRGTSGVPGPTPLRPSTPTTLFQDGHLSRETGSRDILHVTYLRQNRTVGTH